MVSFPVMLITCLSFIFQLLRTTSQHTLYYESYHDEHDFLNNNNNINPYILSINNINITIHSLINININNKMHLNYFNDSHWNHTTQIIQSNDNNSTKRRLQSTNGRYALSPVSMSWHEGVSYCSQHYGSMATILTARDNALAQQTCHWHCWIGLHEDSGKHMAYSKWNSGRKVEYTHWYPGEPNNDYRHGSDCGEIYAEHRGLWNDVPCHIKRFVLCEEGRGKLHGKYIAVQTPKTYAEAEEYCLRRYGNHLATLHSFYDNEDAKKGCNDIGDTDNNEECWIGLKGPFKKWADGVYTGGFLKFSNWYDKQGGVDKTRWRLILRLQHVGKGYFDNKLRVDGIANPNNVEANTFSIIGQLNPDDYKNPIDNKYEFKLVYKNKDGTDVELIWKQSSWLDRPSIEGFEPIQVPGQTASACGQFTGLGYSDSGCSYLDGNGKYHGCWFNSVGTICPWNGGIPGFQWKVAVSQALYIYAPAGATDLCGVIHSDGKWYDKLCSTRKHFICNAMHFSERLSPMARHFLEQSALARHFDEWTKQKELEHMEEIMKRMKEKEEESPLDDPYRLQKEQRAKEEKEAKHAKWESLRSELKNKGIFDRYTKAGYFNPYHLNSMFGNDMRYSFPVQWKRRNRRMLSGIDDSYKGVEYYKCVAMDIYDICVGFKGIYVKNLNLMEVADDNNDEIYDEVEYRMIFIKNDGRQCMNHYICLEMRSDGNILIEMTMIENFDTLMLNFVKDVEWDEIINIKRNGNSNGSIQKCIHLLQIKICIESMSDKMNESLYSASIKMRK